MNRRHLLAAIVMALMVLHIDITQRHERRVLAARIAKDSQIMVAGGRPRAEAEAAAALFWNMRYALEPSDFRSAE